MCDRYEHLLLHPRSGEVRCGTSHHHPRQQLHPPDLPPGRPGVSPQHQQERGREVRDVVGPVLAQLELHSTRLVSARIVLM